MKKLFLPVVIAFLTFTSSCNKTDNIIGAIPGGEIKSTALILVPSANRVNVFDILTNRNIDSLDTDSLPSSIAISPDNRMILVTNYNSGTISVFLRRDNTSFSKLNSIGNGKNPESVIFNPDKNIHEAYVSYSGDSKILVLDTSNQSSAPKILRTLNLGDSTPEKMALSNDGKKIFVTDNKNSRIIVLDKANNFMVSYSPSLKVNNENIKFENMIIDSKDRLFISDSLNSQLIVYDNNDKSIKNVSLKDNAITDSIGPKNIIIYKEKMYVTGYDASLVSVIDINNLKLIKNISLDKSDKASYNPVGINVAINSSKKYFIYVTNSSGRTISIIDPETDLLKENISDVTSLAQQRPLDQILTIGAVM